LQIEFGCTFYCAVRIAGAHWMASHKVNGCGADFEPVETSTMRRAGAETICRRDPPEFSLLFATAVLNKRLQL
jgi:hypothetical protein